jgi:hypothetical protein
MRRRQKQHVSAGNPFYSATDKIYSYTSQDNRLFQLDYFNSPDAAEVWRRDCGGEILESSPGSIWRVHRAIDNDYQCPRNRARG